MKKSELDKFYTKPEIAQQCLNTILPRAGIDLWLEPSAGAGAFYSRLPNPKIGLDIYPDHDSIIQQDFFEYDPPAGKKIAVVGNPPFGKNASLAIRFFNHSAEWASLIAFIVPRTFKKTSCHNKLSLNWVLEQEHDIPKNAFLLIDDNNQISSYNVPCVWQIWVPGSRSKIKLPTTHPDFSFVSKKEADYAIRRVGALAGKCYDSFSEYSESSNYFIKSSPSTFKVLQSCFSEFQEAAKNTAGNPSLSKTELVEIYTQYQKTLLTRV